MEEKIAIYNGSKIYYRTTGNGDIVLLIHGFGETGSVWNNLAAILSAHTKIIIPDIPGSGKSPFLDKKNVNIDDYAKIMKFIIDREDEHNESKINIIGHSMGGYIALAFAALFPGIVGKLGLLHSSAFPDDENKILVRRKAIEFINKNGPGSFLRASIPDLFSEKSKLTCKEIIAKMISNAQHFSPEALIQYYEVMINRTSKTELLQKIEVPVLFIVGEEDKAVPLEQSLKQVHLPKISQVRIFKEVAHMGMFEKQEETSEEVRLFLTV